MATWIWILIAVIVVAILAAAGMAAARQRRTAALRARFGPEYDRAVQERGDRRAAEAELLSRQHERERLDIRPLPEPDRAVFAAEWSDVQESFVDRPADAVIAADLLVTRVMEARGYPMGDFEAQASLVSVDHPGVVANYRSAHDLCERARSGEAGTEDLREALLRYRSLFSELLEPAEGAETGGFTAEQASPAGSTAVVAPAATSGTPDNSAGAPENGPVVADNEAPVSRDGQGVPGDSRSVPGDGRDAGDAVPRPRRAPEDSAMDGETGRVAPESGPQDTADPDYQDAPMNRGRR